MFCYYFIDESHKNTLTIQCKQDTLIAELLFNLLQDDHCDGSDWWSSQFIYPNTWTLSSQKKVIVKVCTVPELKDRNSYCLKGTKHINGGNVDECYERTNYFNASCVSLHIY